MNTLRLPAVSGDTARLRLRPARRKPSRLRTALRNTAWVLGGMAVTAITVPALGFAAVWWCLYLVQVFGG